jgi:hypothetical protein
LKEKLRKPIGIQQEVKITNWNCVAFLCWNIEKTYNLGSYMFEKTKEF